MKDNHENDLRIQQELARRRGDHHNELAITLQLARYFITNKYDKGATLAQLKYAEDLVERLKPDTPTKPN